MREKHLCFILAMSILLCSCAKMSDLSGKIAGVKAYETGVYIPSEQMEKFKDGKTTQADVIAALGHPNNKSSLNKKELWYYDYTKVAAYSYEENINESTVFEFNSKGILASHYKTNQRNTKTGNPLLDQK